MITHWCRDRKGEKLELEKVIKRQTKDLADYIGFKDRGIIKEGFKADINIIDFNNLKLLPPKLIADLPAGGKRLMQNANGYLATIVNGEIIVKNNVFTGKKPGKLVRL